MVLYVWLEHLRWYLQGHSWAWLVVSQHLVGPQEVGKPKTIDSVNPALLGTSQIDHELIRDELLCSPCDR